MDRFTQSSSDDHQHLCYVRCNFCNTVLAVAVPRKRLSETVTVKCGHCSNLSLVGTKIPVQSQCYDHHQISPHQVNYSDKCHIISNNQSEMKKGNNSSPSSSSISIEPLSPDAPFVVKPPEKKPRLPSAYNRFMKEEIQRIKAVNPDISHREAFSAASKNWARRIPSNTEQPVLDGINNV